MEEIRSLMARYCHALDDGRTDDVLVTFCDEAAVEFPGMGRHAGAAALRTAFEGWKPRGPQRHVVSNTAIDMLSDTEARATSDLVFLVKDGNSWRVQIVGRYQDSLCNHDGTWRFHERVATFQ